MSNEIEIKQWLNCDLRVENKVKNIEDDLKNGFLYRDILMRLGLNIPSTIVNKNDEVSIKQNYAFIAGILKEKLKITLQLRAGQHIEVLKQIYKFYQNKSTKSAEENGKEEDTLEEQFNKSLKTKDKHLKKSFKYDDDGLKNTLPPKIQQIEGQLEKFRQQKLRSEILAKSLKDQELERESQWRIEHRQFELNKVRSNHNYLIEKTQTIKENWQKTQDVKSTRLEKEVILNDFLTGRMKNEITSQFNQEFKDYKSGLEYFKENCLHQGISLNHDPDNLKPPPKSNFNMNAAMMKIKEKTHKNILARKDKEKRKNRMLVEQERYEKEIQIKKEEEEMLNGFIEVSAACGITGNHIRKLQEKEAFVVQLRIEREKGVQEERLRYFDQKHEEFREAAIAAEQEKQKNWKVQKVQYLEQNLVEKIQKRKKHSKVCVDLLDLILDVTELCHSQQKHSNSIRVPEQYWRDLMNRFAAGKPLCDEKIVTIFQQGTQDHGSQASIIEDKEENRHLTMMFQHYNMGFGMWQPLHIFEQEENQLLNHAYNDDQLGDFLHEVIDKIHPKKAIKSKPAEIPDYMPLRLSIIGDRFSGKKSISALLKQKYGVQIIEVNEVLENAIKAAFPPVEDENDKKKAAKKPPQKKGQAEEEKPENPELKELGVLANEFKSQNQPFSDEILVKAVVVQIKGLFASFSTEQLVQQITESKQKEEERINLLKKENEELQKKKEKANPKKPNGKESKKDTKQPQDQGETLPDEPVIESTEDAIFRLMSQKEFDFTPGYILLNFPQTQNQAKLLEESLSGFVLEEERLNQEGEAEKLEIAQLVRASERPPDNTLREGALDFVITLRADGTIGEKRAANRRIDPTTGNMYNLEDNQPNLEEKGLADRLQPLDDPEATLELIQIANQKFNQRMEELLPWYNQFGFEIHVGEQEEQQQQHTSHEQIETHVDEQGEEKSRFKENVLNTFVEKDASNRRVEVFEEVDKKISDLLKIKKARAESLIANYLKEQEELKLKQEAEEKEKSEKQKQEEEKLKQQQEAPAAAVAAGSAPVTENVTNTNENNKTVENQEPQESVGSVEVNASANEKRNSSIRPETSVSRVSIEGDFIDALKEDSLKTILKMWHETQSSFIKEIKQSLEKLDTHREVISQRLADVQYRFLLVIQRPDDKQHKITVFQDNLNKFFQENPQMLRFQNTKDELNQHLESIYEVLWDSVEQKKVQSIQERKTIMSSGWFELEISALFGTYQRLFQVEINKLEETLEIILYSGDIAEGRPINEVQEHIILDPFPNLEQLPPMVDPNDINSFPRIDKMFDHFIEKVDKVHELISEIRNKFFKKKNNSSMRPHSSQNNQNIATTWEMTNNKLIDLYNNVLDTQRGVCKYRGYVLKYSLIQRVKELKMIEYGLYAKLDDWIIFGLKHENDVIYEAIRQLRQCINTSTPVDNITVQVKNISDTYKIFTCFNQIPAIIQPVEIIREDEDVRLTIFQLKLLYEELHTLSDKRDGLNVKLYENVMIRRKKLNNVPTFIQKLDDNQVLNAAKNLQPFIQDNKMDLKDLMLCYFLFGSPIPDQDTLETHREHLNSFSSSGYIENHTFLTVECWFDESEKDENIYGFNKFNRVLCLKQLIFDLFAENEPYILSVNKFIDSLKRLAGREKMFFWQILLD